MTYFDLIWVSVTLVTWTSKRFETWHRAFIHHEGVVVQEVFANKHRVFRVGHTMQAKDRKDGKNRNEQNNFGDVLIFLRRGGVAEILPYSGCIRDPFYRSHLLASADFQPPAVILT